MYKENQGVVIVVKSPHVTPRSKHIEVKYYWLG